MFSFPDPIVAEKRQGKFGERTTEMKRRCHCCNVNDSQSGKYCSCAAQIHDITHMKIVEYHQATGMMSATMEGLSDFENLITLRTLSL
ncbi:MAG: hypothetical protein CL912_32870 [Deltaproteobacteria bacterium]|nr:hypothetical protein [Deltaproteobacteria bacterium]|tara:strand:- start:182 stop:445 length:264 start_codon:yes stop_codon:yes gene_type:complete